MARCFAIENYAAPRVKVLLDGVMQVGVVLADPEAGVIYRLKQLDGSGLYYRDERGLFPMERVTGRVELIPDTPSEGNPQ